MNSAKALTFDVVIASRNRADALALSLPLMLNQSRQPKKIIIVDSSDDHEKVRALIEDITSDWPGEVMVIFESAPSSSRQRNIGLEHVTADVVIFPDDDSLILPGAFAEMLRIYELDTDNLVAGVCTAEAIKPPDGLNIACAYQLSFSERIRKKIAKWKTLLERTFVPDPRLSYGRKLIAKRRIPGWLEKENAVAVEWMTGFRMSFRTEVIKKCLFEDVFRGYSLFEDVGASFLAMQHGILVGARNAQIYHHRYPGLRDNGYFLGLAQIANIAYILKKNMIIHGMDRRVVAELYLLACYKVIQYLMGLGSSFGRQRLWGAVRGVYVAGRLFMASENDLAPLYRKEFSSGL